MELAKYLEAEDLTLAQFARQVAPAGGPIPEESTVARWRDGLLFPSPKNMERIEIVTDKTVTYRDFQKVRERTRSGSAFIETERSA